LQLVISGMAQGCIYGLIALGFVLIYKATETVSFAQGELMMLGAFCGLALMTVLGFPFWLAVPSSIAAMAAFGLFAERLVIRPILGQPAFSIVMLTIGINLHDMSVSIFCCKSKTCSECSTNSQIEWVRGHHGASGPSNGSSFIG
jgi:branched-subunit amino acid ABC-type transport system permease component